MFELVVILCLTIAVGCSSQNADLARGSGSTPRRPSLPKLRAILGGLGRDGHHCSVSPGCCRAAARSARDPRPRAS